MQLAFGFDDAPDITWVRDCLRSRFGLPGPAALRKPIGQLVKSSISSRTRDDVSLAAYHRLIDVYPNWSDLIDAPPVDIEAVIADVTFPDVKARYIRDALRAIAARRPDYDLTFLGTHSVIEALEWLERLPGVGRKVSASTLNFSTLHMPAFVIDTHILRVLRRFGLVGSRADTRTAYDIIMAILQDWSAADLMELHVLMKRLGQTICQADRADCRNCPIMERCKASPAHSGIPTSVKVR